MYAWVHEEIVSGRKLTEIINEEHENVKYKPGYKLPHNVIATSDLCSCSKDADILVFVLPSKFLGGVLERMKGVIRPSACAISLMKGNSLLI